MDTAKAANKIIKEAVALLTEKDDIARFAPIEKLFNNAAGAVNGDATNEALLKGWMVSQANNAVFLLWRRGILTDEIEKEYRALPTTEEALVDYNNLMEEDKKKADALEAQRREYVEGQHKLDIFKSILNGVPAEEAEKQYQAYQKKMAEATGAGA